MKATQSLRQVLCWNCEEHVFADATCCPYCQKNLDKPQAQTKITAINHSLEEPIAEDQSESFGQEVGNVLLSLFTLLSGSFFFFFGLLILLFSTNGTFTLEWKATSWPYFVLSALVLLGTGLWSLSKVEK